MAIASSATRLGGRARLRLRGSLASSIGCRFALSPHRHVHISRVAFLTPSVLPRSPRQLFVGVLLTTQPEFIVGIEDVGEARSNAFGAMGMFIATFALSVFGMLRTSPNEKEDLDASAEGYQLSGMGQTEYGSSRYD
ncbi:hypothetical protein ACHAWF_012404 [Thalassiosira exigua]